MSLIVVFLFIDLGANLTMLNDNPLSNSLEVQAPLKNERMAFTPAHSHQEFVKAWSIASRGLRSEEVDTVFFSLCKLNIDGVCGR